jgi:hypothetical protein
LSFEFESSETAVIVFANELSYPPQVALTINFTFSLEGKSIAIDEGHKAEVFFAIVWPVLVVFACHNRSVDLNRNVVESCCKQGHHLHHNALF